MKRSARGNRGKPRAPRREEVATVSIESIAAGGDGVARINGLACFVPRTAPGDVVQIAYTAYARFARGRVLQVLEPSAQRETPRCAHYGDDNCGGCRLQHVSSAAQHDAVQHIVRDAFQRVGHRDIPLPDITAGTPWGYRERLTLALKPRGATWIGGLHTYSDPARIFPLTECPISHPLLVETWRQLRDHLRGLPATPSDGEPLRLSLRLSGADHQRVAVVVQGGTRWPDSKAWASRLHAAADRVVSVWWMRDGSAPQRLWAADDVKHDGSRASATGDALRSEVDDDIGAEELSFAQINSEMAQQLNACVRAAIDAAQPRSVIDAYSGGGELAYALASAGVHVTAIESDAFATTRATQRLAAWPNARVVTALVEDAIAEALPADVVVVNPPRRGVDEQVTTILNTASEQGVRRIVYVSCDPATLARDVARLPRWAIANVQCFDMFPHTAHVETVCVLVPEEA